jgi:hypothetical protein
VSTLAPQGTAEWLEVFHIGKNEWRVSDSRLEAGTDGRLLGFVERLSRDRYEVLWMTEPPRWAYVDSLARAMAAFGDDAGFIGMEVSEREEDRKVRRRFRQWAR